MDPVVVTILQVFVLVGFAAVTYVLALEKGYPRWPWTIVAAVPLVGLLCVAFIVGAPDRRLEEKLNRLV